MKEVYERYTGYVEKNRKRIMDAFDYIWAHPEVGYKEWKTGSYLKEQFRKLGYEVTLAEGIPGFTARLDTGREGPGIAVMGELDALFCENHPAADKETGAVHACGHLIQTSAMLGVAAALKEKGGMDGLTGSVLFVAVPAEETIDLEYRNRLIEKGVIRYVAGKIEFLYRGLLDDVDLAIMFHADSHENKLFKLTPGMDGCITKHMEYKGVAAHAGGAPHMGVNALYAASLGLQACNSLRETFRERDYVRYHPVITGGGGAANIIPGLVKLDTYVRAASVERMLEVNCRINRALAASAAALGANVVIEDKPGNFPLHSDTKLNNLCERVIEDIFGKHQIIYAGWDTQSSDIGDLSSLIPVIQPLCMGAEGKQHGDDYYIGDRDKCVMNPAKVMTCMIYELLKEDAALARGIKLAYKPLYNAKEDYFKAIDAIEQKKELVTYQENGDVLLKLQ